MPGALRSDGNTLFLVCTYLWQKEFAKIFKLQGASRSDKLILNALKSKALIIPPKTRQEAPNLEITIDSCQIFVVESVKYLGIYLDNKLTFGPHIFYLQSKLSRSIGIISKIKYYAELESRTQGSRPRPRTQKNPRPRPRTAFPRTDSLEAKDRNARGQGQGPKTRAQEFKKKVFFRRPPKKKIF